MSGSMHRPAAAWSRDSLTAWEYVFATCDPTRSSASDKSHSHYHFMRRWAIKIVNLVDEEMGTCDWYYFLRNHFDERLKQMDQYHKPIMRDQYRDPNTLETDPKC